MPPTDTPTPPNNAPQFSVTALPDAVVGQFYQADIGITDADGDVPTVYTSTIGTLPAWLTLNIDPGGVHLFGTVQAGDAPVVYLWVTADDGKGGVTLQPYTINIVNPSGSNQVGSAGTPENAMVGVPYSYSFPVVDPVSGHSLTPTSYIQIPAWLTLADPEHLQGVPSSSDQGPNTVSVQLTDQTTGVAQLWTFTINVLPASTP